MNAAIGWFRRWVWVALALEVWLGGLIGISIEAYLRPSGHTVFDIYSYAGQHWVTGDDLFAKQPDHNWEFFRYSPLCAVLLVPFASVSPGLGNASWKLVNAGIFLWGQWVWCRRALPGVPSANRTAAIFLLGIPVVVGSLHVGQANLLTTGLVLFGLTAIVDNRWWQAGGFLAAATLVKVYPFALAAVLAVLFWQHFPVRYLIGVAIGLALPFLAQSPDYVPGQCRSWVVHLAESPDLNFDRVKSLAGFLNAVGWGVPPKAFMAIGAAAGLGVLGISLWYQRVESDRRELLARVLAWFTAWALLFNPATEAVTYAILAPSLTLALVQAVRRPGAWLTRLLLVATIWLTGLTATDVTPPVVAAAINPYAPQAIGALLFVATLIADAVRTLSLRRT